MLSDTKVHWYKQLHWQIIIGLVLGIIYGLIASYMGWMEFTEHWIKPWGTIFINLLKLIAVPMIIASLICGVASLSDLTRLSRIGGKTIGLYIGTTIIAITIGLVLVNLLKPGKAFPENIRRQLHETYKEQVEKKEVQATKQKKTGPLQPIVNIVPANIVEAASENRNMLQIVFVSMLIGVGIVKSQKEKTKAVLAFFNSLYEVIIQVVDIIMKLAPLGVFAQLASVITGLAGKNPLQALTILKALGFYMLVVLAGLVIHVFLVYASLLKIGTPISLSEFFQGIRPAQFIAFSTSSSAATLPVTMKCCEENLGVSEEITSFTLPVGATVNMDGTSLYQAVAAVFIAQLFNIDLTFAQQVIIVLTVTLASIGAAGVPGAGIVMLVIVLQAIGVSISGIAIILGVDRILDMFRTVANITGDSAVTSVVAMSEGKLNFKSGGRLYNGVDEKKMEE